MSKIRFARLILMAALVTSVGLSAVVQAQTDEHDHEAAGEHSHVAPAEEVVAPAPAEMSSGQKLASFIAETVKALDRSPMQRRGKSMRELADAAAAQIETIEDDPELEGAARHFLGTLCHAIGDLKAAEMNLGQALQVREDWIGRDHEDTIATARALGALALQMRQLTRADALGQMVLRRYERSYPLDHRGRVQGFADLAAVRVSRGKADEAEQLLRDAIDLERESGRPVDGFTVTLLEQLSSMILAEHRFAEAVPVIESVIEAQKAAFGPADIRTLQTMDMLVALLVSEKRVAEARPILRELVVQFTSIMGASDPEVLDMTFALADAALAVNELAEAEQLHRRVLELRSSALGPDHSRVAESYGALAAVLERAERWSDAEPLRRSVWERHTRILGAEHATTLAAQIDLARTLVPLERFDDCEVLLIPAYEKLGDVTAPNDKRRSAAALVAVELYTAWERPGDAERYRAHE